MKNVLAVLLAVVLVVGLLLPGIPLLAEGRAGMSETPATTPPQQLSARLAADIQQLREAADEQGRVTVVIKLEGQALPGMAQERAVEALQQQSVRSQERVLQFLHARGATVLNTFWLTNAVLAEVPVALLDNIAAFAEVERLFENFTVTIPEPEEEEEHIEALSTSYTWGLNKMRAPEVWNELGVTGSGVRVAVLDTGVDISHPDLTGRMWTDNPADPTYPGGWIEFDGNGSIVTGSTPYDSGSHGTHCSGTVLGGDAGGTAIGVAPDACLMHGLVLHGSSGSFAQVIAGMQWAINPVDQHGNPAGQTAGVVSMSLGATGYHDVMIEPVQNMRAAGIVPVIAIGNSGEGSLGSPGNVYDSFAIGATDIDDNVGSFSSGAVIDWPASHPEPYIKPDFSAPGVSVYSAVPGGGYGSWSGTSMATPHVAGVAALMLEADPGLTVDEIHEILKDTAIWYDQYYPEPPCTRYGWGRIDALEAVYLVALDSGIDGIVTDVDTGEPLKQATIVISETGQVRYTDESGYYRFFLPPGTYTLTGGGFGYYQESAIVEVMEGAFTAQDFALEPMPTGFITGTVTDAETGQPIAEASVALLDTPLTVPTDQSGGYSMEAPIGNYDVRAGAWRYKASVVPHVDVLEDDTVTIDFALEGTLCVAVLGDYNSQLTQLLTANDILAEHRDWGITGDIDRYDAVVVNHPSNPGKSAFLSFLDAAGDDGVGIVFTSSYLSQYLHYGISLLQRHLGDPPSQGDGYGLDKGDIYYHVTEPHPIFEGWEIGDTITIIGTGWRDHAWFRDYSGYTLADVGSQKDGILGDGVALGEYGESHHVLLASLAPNRYTHMSHWTDDAKTIFVRGVLYAGGLLDAGLRVITGQLPAGAAAIEYQATIEAAGGTKPYTWAIIDGALPAGLALEAASGVISGTPAATGTFAFTVQVSDSEEDTAVADLSIIIVDSLAIITSELPDGQEGVHYQTALEAAGGLLPYTWAITAGALPTGLDLDAATGAISGTSTTDGTFDFIVQVTDDSEQTATGELSITIEAGPLAIVTTNLPDGQLGVAYDTAVEAAGGTKPYTWAITGGSLPEGLALNADAGTISGTPTADGTFDFTVEVMDSAEATAVADLSISIIVEPLEIITSGLPDGQEGVAYEAILEAAGGTEPYTWAIIDGALPTGLEFNADSGVISGTPVAAGTFDFNVQVTDGSAETATTDLSIRIAAGPLKIITTELPDGQAGAAYQATLEATGGTKPYTWAIADGSLPTGLELDAASGVISGTPTADGTFDFTVQVTDSSSPGPRQMATADLYISVAAGPLEIITSHLPAGQVDAAYQATLEATGGTEPYTWAIADGSLPTGLELDAASGVISGTPTTVDIFDFTVQVMNPTGETAIADLSITINLEAVAEIAGQTREVNCAILAGATITAYLDGVVHASTVSDDGNYILAVSEPGTYQVVASKDGFRAESRSINITELGQQYDLDFRRDHGLIPNAPDVYYVLQCVNLWLYPPGEECALSVFKVLAVVNAWTYPK